MATVLTHWHPKWLEKAKLEFTTHPIRVFLALVAGLTVGGSFGVIILYTPIVTGDVRALVKLFPHAFVTMLVPTLWIATMFSLIGREP